MQFFVSLSSHGWSDKQNSQFIPHHKWCICSRFVWFNCVSLKKRFQSLIHRLFQTLFPSQTSCKSIMNTKWVRRKDICKLQYHTGKQDGVTCSITKSVQAGVERAKVFCDCAVWVYVSSLPSPYTCCEEWEQKRDQSRAPTPSMIAVQMTDHLMHNINDQWHRTRVLYL